MNETPILETPRLRLRPFALADAAERLLVALRRLEQRQQADYDSPAFGPMSHEDRVRLNLRHAELHLGYLSY